jgi:hypothetical protein
MIFLTVLLTITSCLQFTNQDISKLYTGNYSIYCYHSFDPFWLNIESNYTKVEIQSNETEILSVLELRHFPTYKVLQEGKVYTFDREVDEKRVQSFLKNFNRARYHNYLPVSYSIWSKLQLDFYLYMLQYQETLAQSIGQTLLLWSRSFRLPEWIYAALAKAKEFVEPYRPYMNQFLLPFENWSGTLDSLQQNQGEL